MRIAVLSDIHGFDLAFERVIADLDATGPYDAVVVAGDLCEAGPRPDRVLELIRERGYLAVQGNTDYDVVHGRAYDDPQIAYAREMIGRDGIEYLDRLPFELRFTPPGGASPADDLLVVHANPHDQLRALDPALSDRELRTILDPVEASVIAFGHIHIAYIRELDDLLLVDVSAVGNPKDGDLRCKYGVLTWDAAASRWQAELRYLPYPLEETEEEMLASDMPRPKKAFKKLQRASYREFD
jgi:predicted phosphodiesterase